MGVHKAAHSVQQHIRHYNWYGKIDISHYFANYYLDGLDRLLDRLQDECVHVRYILWLSNTARRTKAE